MTEEVNKQEDEKHWQMILWLFFMYSYIQYAEFEDEILNKNRFVSSEAVSLFLNEIEKEKQSAITTIPKHTNLFRARITDNSYAENWGHDFYLKVFEEKPDDQTIKLFSNETALKNMMLFLLPFLDKNPPFAEKLIKYIANFLEKDFQGYEYKDCLAPPNDKAVDGRVNPKNISYLYTAECPDTAIYEVKPIIGQLVSVASLRTNKELTLLDLTKDTFFKPISFDNGTEYNSPTVMQVISEQFEKPNHNNELGYIPTQFIAEFAKTKLKVDGIKFKSSLHPNGVNVVLFDTQCCEVVNSKIYSVDSIQISSHNIEEDVKNMF